MAPSTSHPFALHLRFEQPKALSHTGFVKIKGLLPILVWLVKGDVFPYPPLLL